MAGEKKEEERASGLQKWISAQVVGDEMLWKGGFGRQMQFMRDCLGHLMCWGLKYDEHYKVSSVVSEHRSKSINLPVVSFERNDIGLRIIVRNNFYNWKMSVISSKSIEANFDGLFHTTPPIEPSYTGNPLASVYFEGFPEHMIFGYYSDSDKKKFSAEIGSDEQIWTVLFLILRGLGVIKPYVWHTKESYAKELASMDI